MAGRCVVKGKIVTTEELPAYCAVALAGIGSIPDTILTRSVVVRMRRRAPTEAVEPYRRRIHAPAGHAIRERLEEWVADVSPQFQNVYPTMPAGVEDRAADVWESLLAVADAAGGDWPKLGRVAAVALVAEAKQSTPSVGVRLLSDLRQLFGEREALSTGEILRVLCGMDEAPWGDLRGRALDSRRLANYLRPYGVQSKTVRIGTSTPRGYTRADLLDAWSRYLGPAAIASATCATNDTPIDPIAATGADVAHVAPVNGATGAKVVCEDCQHFKASTNGHGLGSCQRYGTDAGPSTPFTCPGFEERSV
jgi:hypothetical protein